MRVSQEISGNMTTWSSISWKLATFLDYPKKSLYILARDYLDLQHDGFFSAENWETNGLKLGPTVKISQ